MCEITMKSSLKSVQSKLSNPWPLCQNVGHRMCSKFVIKYTGEMFESNSWDSYARILKWCTSGFWIVKTVTVEPMLGPQNGFKVQYTSI